ncbi:MAG: hypothetical protein Q8P18_05630 [Pseudomonadota bacterium]|nr:hypothetical protein [Pseudomonadota bacterium]
MLDTPSPTPLGRGDVLLAGAVAAFVVVAQLIWLSQDQTPAGADSLSLLRIVACFTRATTDALRCAVEDPHPPVVTMLAGLHGRLLGQVDARIAAMALWPFLALGAAALYLSVRQASDRLAGVTAVALATVVYSDTAMRGAFTTENALFWWIPAVVACLVASRRFTRPALGLLVGATTGIALLVKWSAAFFLFAPVGGGAALALGGLARPLALRVALSITGGAILLLTGVAMSGKWEHAGDALPYAGAALVLSLCAALHPRFRAPEPRRRLLALLLAAMGVSIVAGPWYVAALPILRKFFDGNMAGVYDGEQFPISAVWWFYPATLLTMVQTPILVLAAVGAARQLKSPRIPVVYVSVLALLTGMFVLAWLPYRVGRYLLPGFGLLAAPAALATLGLGRLTRVLQGAILGLALLHQTSWWVVAAVPALGGASSWLEHLGQIPQVEQAGNDSEALMRMRSSLRSSAVRFALIARYPIPPDGSVRDVALEAAAIGASSGWTTLATEAPGFDPAHIEVQWAFDDLGRWAGTFPPQSGLAGIRVRYGRRLGLPHGVWPRNLLILEFVPSSDPTSPVRPESGLAPELLAAQFVLVDQWEPQAPTAGGLYLWRGPPGGPELR